MDALGDYGSDSSSASAEQKVNDSKKNALSGLLGHASSDDDSDDEIGRQQHLTKSQAPPPTKRQRVDSTRFTLPSPPLDGSKSLIHWDVNYLEERTASAGSNRLETDTASITNDLSQKLERLSKTLKVSWAEHLKSQHEFHNPHFFESVVEHFGIAIPLGSQNRNEANLKDYEMELIPKRNIT